MEVGAVKQAFNNEVILLKKKLNQAKVQIIHKLTRKAKTLLEKKAPDNLKEKFKKKAESAVNEVLIIKKIKPRDIAKFMITHTGEVKDYLNKPIVDNDKACARLVLHKALQDKYNFIRNIFGNVPIKDLFMGRQERRKLKKEARELQKNKKKGKNSKAVNTQGDWDVENIKMDEDDDDISFDGGESDQENSDIINEHLDRQMASGDESEENVEMEYHNSEDNANSEDSASNSDGNAFNSEDNATNSEDNASNSDDNATVSELDIDENDDNNEIGKFVKLKPKTDSNKTIEYLEPAIKVNKNVSIPKTDNLKTKLQNKKQTVKKNKQNKNLKEKLQSRKIKNNDSDIHIEDRKVVDPFFITATGGNYLSLAEPREPDEVKEVHKQGNRRERRAAMFGYVPKSKPRKDNFRENNFKTNKFDRDNNGTDFRDKNGIFNNKRFKNDGFDRNKFTGNGNANTGSKYNDKNSNFNDAKFKNDQEEKLHPSWEAKKKLSSILPFQGKKIVFDES